MGLIHVTGSPGSGVTTLGAALARALSVPHLDTDPYVWLPTDPPYRRMAEPAERLRRLDADLAPHARCVVSGSLIGWAGALEPRLEHVILLHAPAALRVERIRRRERERFGDAVLAGGPMHAQHHRLLLRAASYDEGRDPRHRNRAMHEAWLATLACPVLRLDGAEPVQTLLERALAAAPLPATGA